jgi:Holliday junction resolvase RusA-like endonuclease
VITLTGRIPSKKNSRINTKSGRSFPSKEYSAWHKSATIQLLSQGVKRDKIDKLESIQLDFVFGDNLKTDLTNKAESVMDLLVDYGFILDDNRQVVPKIILTGRYEKGLFGCEITYI